MANLTDKIENVLNESRILVLGMQILIGFDFRTFFEPGYLKMAPWAQQTQLAALALMLVGLGVLLVPPPYHRIVLHGRNTAGLHRLATMTVSLGLLPFALAMGLSFFLGARWAVGNVVAGTISGVVLVLALLLWYGVEWLARRRKAGHVSLYELVDPLRGIDMRQEQDTSISTRIKQVLIECRVVLPGAQALLGFQLIIMWMTAFYGIPQVWKLLHLASLTSVAICTILLIMPAAYHRIVEHGEDSERLHRVTAHALLWAMGFLALGVCGDFYVVSRMTGIGMPVSAGLSVALLLFFFGAWYGFALWSREKLQPRASSSQLEPRQAA